MCHDGGDVLCCDKCPRVFHIQCSGLSRAPEGDEEWYCPVCKVREREGEGEGERARKREYSMCNRVCMYLSINVMMYCLVSGACG